MKEKFQEDCKIKQRKNSNNKVQKSVNCKMLVVEQKFNCTELNFEIERDRVNSLFGFWYIFLGKELLYLCDI